MAKCSVCGKEFAKRTPQHRLCALECAIVDMRGKQVARRKKADRERLEALKSTNDLAAEAQTAFNAYIRERDLYLPCRSCGQSAFRGQRHAGHYRTRASAPQLRYNVFNTNAQCAMCNEKKSGNLIEYRKGLILKYGEDRVTAIENDNRSADFDKDYLRRLKKVFNRRKRHVTRLRQRILARDTNF